MHVHSSSFVVCPSISSSLSTCPLPHIQALYYDAVLYFPEEMTKILEVMEEKELRIRAPLEEVKLLLEATAEPVP